MLCSNWSRNLAAATGSTRPFAWTRWTRPVPTSRSSNGMKTSPSGTPPDCKNPSGIWKPIIRATLIVGLPPRLTSFWSISSQTSNFLSNSPFLPGPAGGLEQLQSPCQLLWEYWEFETKPLQANYLMWRAAAASMAYMNEVEQKRQFSLPKFLLTQSKGRGQDQFKILKEADREVRRAAKVA